MFVLTIEGPKRNALAPELCNLVISALTQAADAGARAVVLTAAGETFCAGFDLDAFPSPADPQWEQWVRSHGQLGSMMRAISDGPLPVVAALNGPTIGAGCELALACDLRVAHPGAWLQMPPVRLGLVYTPEGMTRLIAACGHTRARQILLTGDRIQADEAERWGLVNRVVPAAELRSAALSFARTLAAHPAEALRGTRQVLERLVAEGPQLGASSLAEIHALRDRAYGSEESRAARQAIVGRRQRDPKAAGAAQVAPGKDSG